VSVNTNFDPFYYELGFLFNGQDSDTFVRSNGQTDHNDNSQGSDHWTLFKDQQGFSEYQVLDFFRFYTNLNPNDPFRWDDYSIRIRSLPGHGVVSDMWLQVGNQSMQGNSLGNGTWQFDFKDNPGLLDYLNGTDLMQTQDWVKAGVGNPNTAVNSAYRTFTIIPYFNNNNHGRDSVVVSTGPQFYDVSQDFDPARQVVSVSTSSGDLKDVQIFNDVISDNSGTAYNIYVGSIADWMLRQEFTNHLHLIVDGHNGSSTVENGDSGLLLSQYLYIEKSQDSDKDGNNWLVWLPNDFQIAVTGTNQDAASADQSLQGAKIDGLGSRGGTFNDNKKGFYNGLLDIFSEYTAAQFTSAQVSGITFTNPVTRNSGSVHVNTNFSPAGYVPTKSWFEFWSDDPQKTAEQKSNEAYGERLQNVLTALETFALVNDINGQSTTSVKLWDNQILGWETASDGFEVSSPNLFSAKNFIKVNDDALKVLSHNQTFVENTIHLGPSGAGINISGYGASNGAVHDNKIAGTFAHRIVNPVETENNQGSTISFGGFLADWTAWGLRLTSPGNFGISNNDIRDIYMPSAYNGAIDVDANQLGRNGITSAVSEVGGGRDIFRNKIFDAPAGSTFKGGGYTIENWNNYLSSGAGAMGWTPNPNEPTSEQAVFKEWTEFGETTVEMFNNSGELFGVDLIPHTLTKVKQFGSSRPTISGALLSGPEGSQISSSSVKEGEIFVADFDSVGLDVSWSLPQWADSNLFEIDAVTGVLKLNKELDYQNPVDMGFENLVFGGTTPEVDTFMSSRNAAVANNIYSVTVQASEKVNPTNTSFQTLRVQIDPSSNQDSFVLPELEVNANSNGLTIDALSGQKVWVKAEILDFTISSNLSIAFNNQSTSQLLGSLGVSPGMSLTKSSALFLLQSGDSFAPQLSAVGQSQPFSDISYEFVEDDDAYLLNVATADGANQVNIRLETMQVSQPSSALDISRRQVQSHDVIYDFTNIEGEELKVQLDVETISGYRNSLYFVKLDNSSLFNSGYSVDGVDVSNTDAFRDAVMDNLINFNESTVVVGGGDVAKNYQYEWILDQSDAGLYAPVLVNPLGEIFTLGVDSSYGVCNAKVLSQNVFGIEDLRGGGDVDANDIIIKASVVA